MAFKVIAIRRLVPRWEDGGDKSVGDLGDRNRGLDDHVSRLAQERKDPGHLGDDTVDLVRRLAV